MRQARRWRALLVLAALMSGLVTVAMPSPAHADETERADVPDVVHVVGGVSRARISGSEITWHLNGYAQVPFLLKDMSTDGYCARVWIMGAYDTSYWTGAWSYKMHSRTSCNGQDEALAINVGLENFCFDDPHGCYDLEPRYLRIEVGRAKSASTSPPKDLTLVGYFGNPFQV
ncbi:hypothetical protein [Asanoa iriomotensis]|uniref:Secreted protein n=1 Tax=Asanoa iriomotensis TaxID=234613 RepID=A0ABQ4C9U4_9ACTN|nr:hypothetical protein [Asanoa iriomotensis]GIF59551.1 hypothetical protein Air01nite_56460 [Asanoa iriomotensis]